MQSTQSRIRFLMQIINIPPEAWDFIFPHGPAFKSIAIREYMMSAIVRDVAAQITDRALAAKAKGAGGEMVKHASANLINGWEDGDDICPPFPWPWPWNDGLKPQPDPWFQRDFTGFNPETLTPKTIGNALRVIAKLTSLPEVSKQLNEVAGKVAPLRALDVTPVKP